MNDSRRPIVIIGAPRSGTNMLRDVLTQLPGLGTWPCDEINYLWRYGNAKKDTDELQPEDARPEICSYVGQAFDKIAQKRSVNQVVEKTCANSLRVCFVNTVLPDALYIYIVRDGRDAAASAVKRWRANLSLPYTLRKVRYVPLRDLPTYGLRFVRNRAHRLRSSEGRISSWGPRFEGIDELLEYRSLLEVCAFQWKRCVDLSDDQLAQVAEERVHRLRYEDFIADATGQLNNVCRFLEKDCSARDVGQAINQVVSANVGKWKTELDHGQVSSIEQLLGESLARHAYLGSK